MLTITSGMVLNRFWESENGSSMTAGKLIELVCGNKPIESDEAVKKDP